MTTDVNKPEIKKDTTPSIVRYMAKESVKSNITETLGKKAPQFIASVASLVNANEVLKGADQRSVLLACLTAASLDLPINQNLGLAFIIPYKKSIKNEQGKIVGYETIAQFQIGYKGFTQLAMRSGQFQTLNVTDVREGEITAEDLLSGEMVFSWVADKTEREKKPIIGYVAYMRLLNGFTKSLYMTKAELERHGMRFSQTMRKGYGLWKDDFDAMAKKTVIKLLLSKYAPMTVEMQKATLADQAEIGEDGNSYIDNQRMLPEEVAHDKERERIKKYIAACKTVEDLDKCAVAVAEDEELFELSQAKRKELQK